ncbi:hypothetical protein [Pseudooceanicola nanhaiensis]|uniref:hypothetical protein n=1 Tax=Pseudooceanicola nanhaiensis TaxID=375761 RepID=UPI001CD76D25|nr:hypothetical protein [Pseudooceanicola nanhaiensis]MCA0920105.1 hypothetical protein [Pseudooceanicola nanhaiensis]
MAVHSLGILPLSALRMAEPGRRDLGNTTGFSLVSAHMAMARVMIRTARQGPLPLGPTGDVRQPALILTEPLKLDALTCRPGATLTLDPRCTVTAADGQSFALRALRLHGHGHGHGHGEGPRDSIVVGLHFPGDLPAEGCVLSAGPDLALPARAPEASPRDHDHLRRHLRTAAISLVDTLEWVPSSLPECHAGAPGTGSHA